MDSPSLTYPHAIRLGYGTFNVFQRWWWGQSDPLYAVLSRRGNSVDWVVVYASPAEVERLVEVAHQIIDSTDSDKQEKYVATGLLALLSQEGLANGGMGPGAIDLGSRSEKGWRRYFDFGVDRSYLGHFTFTVQIPPGIPDEEYKIGDLVPWRLVDGDKVLAQGRIDYRGAHFRNDLSRAARNAFAKVNEQAGKRTWGDLWQAPGMPGGPPLGGSRAASKQARVKKIEGAVAKGAVGAMQQGELASVQAALQSAGSLARGRTSETVVLFQQAGGVWTDYLTLDVLPKMRARDLVQLVQQHAEPGDRVLYQDGWYAVEQGGLRALRASEQPQLQGGSRAIDLDAIIAEVTGKKQADDAWGLVKGHRYRVIKPGAKLNWMLWSHGGGSFKSIDVPVGTVLTYRGSSKSVGGYFDSFVWEGHVRHQGRPHSTVTGPGWADTRGTFAPESWWSADRT
jgi:hypothetical protein